MYGCSERVDRAWSVSERRTPRSPPAHPVQRRGPWTLLLWSRASGPRALAQLAAVCQCGSGCSPISALRQVSQLHSGVRIGRPFAVLKKMANTLAGFSFNASSSIPSPLCSATPRFCRPPAPQPAQMVVAFLFTLYCCFRKGPRDTHRQ